MPSVFGTILNNIAFYVLLTFPFIALVLVGYLLFLAIFRSAKNRRKKVIGTSIILLAIVIIYVGLAVYEEKTTLSFGIHTYYEVPQDSNFADDYLAGGSIVYQDSTIQVLTDVPMVTPKGNLAWNVDILAKKPVDILDMGFNFYVTTPDGKKLVPLYDIRGVNIFDERDEDDMSQGPGSTLRKIKPPHSFITRTNAKYRIFGREYSLSSKYPQLTFHFRADLSVNHRDITIDKQLTLNRVTKRVPIMNNKDTKD